MLPPIKMICLRSESNHCDSRVFVRHCVCVFFPSQNQMVNVSIYSVRCCCCCCRSRRTEVLLLADGSMVFRVPKQSQIMCKPDFVYFLCLTLDCCYCSGLHSSMLCVSSSVHDFLRSASGIVRKHNTVDPFGVYAKRVSLPPPCECLCACVLLCLSLNGRLILSVHKHIILG